MGSNHKIITFVVLVFSVLAVKGQDDISGKLRNDRPQVIKQVLQKDHVYGTQIDEFMVGKKKISILKTNVSQIQYVKTSGKRIDFYRGFGFEEGGFHRVKFDLEETRMKSKCQVLFM